MASGSGGIEVLTQGFGYGIIIGIGAFFALLMLILTYFQNRYTNFSTQNPEEFSTASRSVKPGLIAAGIVSSWTWSATLLTSSTFAYTYGISGEIVLSRNGCFAHLTYWFFGWATNMLVGACLVLGGSQVVSAMSGVSVYAACWIIPFVVAAYVVAGGLRSTFVADYTHTAILFIAIFVFGFTVFLPSGPLGGLDRFYDLLVEASEKMPIKGNYKGSYLTFQSVDGLVFAWNLLIAGFCNVWLDQAYWQRAIASQPHTTVKAYIAGGIAWYGIPFGFATAMGLGCVALTNLSLFPTYPEPLTAAQNGAGLSAPAAAIALLGTGGAGLMLLLLFMAVTSATSAELIAVSSLLTYDIYKTYIRPRASSNELVRASHYGIVLYAAALAGFCCVLNAVSINLTWILTVLGVIVGGGAFPVALVLLWRRMSWTATVVSPWLGLTFGLTAWMVVTKQRSGSINVHNTGEPLNALAGNVTSLMTGLLASVLLSFLFPRQYSSTNPDDIARANKIKGYASYQVDGHSPKAEPSPSQVVEEKHGSALQSNTGPDQQVHEIGRVVSQNVSDEETGRQSKFTAINGVVKHPETSYIEPLDSSAVRDATRLAIGFNVVFIIVAVLLVPYSLYGSSWIFSRAGFKGWCVVSFVWVWVGMIICVIWPLVESWSAILEISKGIISDLSGFRGGRRDATQSGQ